MTEKAEPIDVTARLAGYVAQARFDQLPPAVVREGTRALLHIIGCAIGGCRHPSMDITLRALGPFAGAAQATIFGRPERTDVLHAALLNGIASHVLDFDDTHPDTLVHPSGPVAAAVLALGEHRGASGAAVLNAFVVGVEVENRIARSVLPAHYDVGWHLTGTAGVFGAAAGCANLLGLDAQHTTWALGLAATQSAALREMFGSMAKSFHPGGAARNGAAAALMAAQGFTSAERGIEGKTGFAHVTSTTVDLTRAVDGLGERYDLLGNTYKPYACGLVIHPVIDACVQLAERHGLTADAIDRIDMRVNRYALELTGKPRPTTGLEGKFSIFHSAAVAIIDRAGGEAQYADARVNAPEVVALRSRVHAEMDPQLSITAVHVTITTKAGARHAIDLEHCLGSREAPMSDAQMHAKFRALAEGILAPPRIESALAALEGLARAASIGAVLRHCAP